MKLKIYHNTKMIGLYKTVFTIICTLLQFFGKCQPNEQIICDVLEDESTYSSANVSSNGRHCTPKGELKILIVYVGFIGYENSPSVNGWTNDVSLDYELPAYIINQNGTYVWPEFMFNENSDFDNSQLVASYPSNVSNTLNKMSHPNEDFEMVSEIFSDPTGKPVLVLLDPSQFTSATSFSTLSKAAYDKMWTINSDPNYYRQFDQRVNTPYYVFDNSINISSDDYIDYIVFVFRYSRQWSSQPINGMNTWNGAGGGVTHHTFLHNHSQIGFDGGFIIGDGGTNQRQVFIHEFAHSIYNMPHVAGTNGVVGNYFSIPVTGLGSTAWLPMFEPMLCSWERWYIGFADPIDVTTDGVYELRDYVTTGDAIRIQLPFSNNQNLWLEYHNREDELDNHPYYGISLGPEINSEYVTLGNSATGVFLYTENITSSRNTLGTITETGANGLMYINSTGNWNYVRDNAAGIKTNAWGQPLNKYVRGIDFAIGGQNIWNSHISDVNSTLL